MKTFPMFLKVAERRIVIVGGGEQAAQKTRLTMKSEAKLVLLAQHLDPELADIVRSGRAEQIADAGCEIFEDTALVFIATGCKGADASWHALAKSAHALVNVVDYPDLCDAITPSIVDRDPVVVAIGTEGNAPVLGRRIKSRIEELLHPRLGSYAALAGRLRSEVALRIAQADRRSFWAWVFTERPWAIFSTGNEQEAAREIKAAIRDGRKDEDASRLTVVLNVGQDGDLLPLRAVQRMQEADVILADQDIPDTVLELARRDAERVRISATPETPANASPAHPPWFSHSLPGARTVYLTTAATPVAVPDGMPANLPVEQMFSALSVPRQIGKPPAAATNL